MSVDDPVAEAPHGNRVRAIAAALFALSAFVYCTNLRPMGAWDSMPARWLPFSILREGNFTLDEFTWLRIPRPAYFLRRNARHHWVSAYPVATPLLATPLYLPAWAWARWNAIEDDDVRLRVAAAVSERLAAAVITAASVALLFAALATLTSTAIAVAIALVYAFGTNTWAISSQALWQHGTVELCLAGLSWMFLRPPARATAIAAGVFATLAVAARPTAAILALAALVFMYRNRRAQLGPFLLIMGAGVALVVWYNVNAVGAATGGYKLHKMIGPLDAARLPGVLLSPNRGLLVYTPAAILGLSWRPRTAGWLSYLWCSVAAYLLLFGSAAVWWGGYCYGPRYLTDALPALALCAVAAVERLARTASGRAFMAALALWGVAVQFIGVYCDDGAWNRLPTSVDTSPQRLWDWRDLQVVRAVRGGFHGADRAALLWQTLTDPRPVLLRPIPAAQLTAAVAIADAAPQRVAAAGGTVAIDLHVANTGRATWPAFSDHGYRHVAVAYRWWTTTPSASGAAAPRRAVLASRAADDLQLPRNLAAGESADIRGRMRVPVERGVYDVELVVGQRLSADALTPAGSAATRVVVQ